ncbi:ABC transporter substrate-binding protein [Nonomuraea basaltis]|uniref:ABC transporter substrate-binding protein n=1 Tax=Nonomuraea basaltis TaxID=2495887 RepID=UPI001F0EA097|nr:ABC transporter substrate-binding protein [Nonomuraea basaltis]
MTRKLRCSAVALGVAVALVLTGCSSSDSSTSASAGANGLEKSTIKVGAIPIPDSVSLYVAINKGYFKQEGLTVEPVTITGGAAAMPKLMSGELDATLQNYVSGLVAFSKGQKIKLVAEASQGAPNTFNIMVPKDSPINTVADLKGKTVAVNTLNNIATLAVETQLKVAGLTKDDVKYKEVAFPDMGNALTNGLADAGWMVEPFITTTQSTQGFRKLADTMTGQTENFPISGWSVTEAWAQKNPKTVAAFQRAIAKALKDLSTDRKELEKALPTYTKIDAKTASVITPLAYPTELTANRLQKVADLLLEYKYIESQIDVKSIIVPAPPAG